MSDREAHLVAGTALTGLTTPVMMSVFAALAMTFPAANAALPRRTGQRD